VTAQAPVSDDSVAVHDAAPYAWRVLSVTGLGTILGFFDGNSLPIAMPAIGRYYGVGTDKVSWLVLGYLLAVTSLILMFGRLADQVGRKRLYLFGMIVIVIASLSAAASPNVDVMIGLRALQGIGSAAILANTTALIVEAFPPRLLTTGLSLNVTVVSASTVLAPVISGGLVSTLGWRAVFLVNGPVGITGILWALRTLRPDLGRRAGRERLNASPAILAAACLAALVYVCDQGPTIGWSSTQLLTVAAVGVAAGVAFGLVEHRSARPLISPELFRLRSRAMAFLAATAMIISNSSLVLLMSLYLQSVKGLNAWNAGLGVMTSAVGVVTASLVAGTLARRIPSRLLSSAGLLLVAGAVTWLAVRLGVDTPRMDVSLALLTSGLGVGLFQGPNTASMMSTLPAPLRSIASAVRSTIQCAAQVIGVTVGLTLVTAASPANLDSLVAGSGNQAAVKMRLVTGFHHAFTVLAIVAFVGTLISLTRGPVSAPGSFPAADLPTAPGE
jgi:EmrB/QacA subfamily drug resistance transporter